MRKLNLFRMGLLISCITLFAMNAQAQSTGVAPNRFTRGAGHGMKSVTNCALSCQTNYISGTTMVLDFTITFASPDFEYMDGFSMTFPAGMTPIVTGTSDPLSTPISGFAGNIDLNLPVSGQTISWGTIPGSTMEGVLDPGTYVFQVGVSIGAGVSGNQTVSYTLYGDTYGAPPDDCSGSCIVTMAPANDVLTSSIDVGNLIAPGTPVIPKATFKNGGTATQTFNVTMIISPGAYASTTTVTGLTSGSTQQVSFAPNWTPLNGMQNITVYTSLASDINRLNDTLKQAVMGAFIPHTKVFAYNASGTIQGPYSFYLDNPGNATLLANQTTLGFLSGGDWANDKWYASVFADSTLVTIDTTTGARTVKGPLGAQVNGLAWDPTTSTMYGISYTDPNSILRTINLNTGATAIVGTICAGVLINLACSPGGQLYATDIVNDELYSVNKLTGAGTLIGNIGFDASYAQSMDFDFQTGQCFMAAYNNTTSLGELRLVDLVRGTSFFVDTLYNGDEFDAMTFVKSCGLSVDMIADTVCAGHATNFTDLSGGVTTGAVYAWDFDNNGTVDATTTGNATHVYPQHGTYTAELRITNYQGCTDSTILTVVVDSCCSLIADAIADTVCVGNATSFTDLSTSVDPGASYAWDFNNDGTVDNTTVGNTTTTYATAGTYTVTLKITNDLNCADSITFDVLVDACTGIRESGELTFRIAPNPNKGQFVLDFSGHVSLPVSITIYNTMGQSVFSEELVDTGGGSDYVVNINNLSDGLYMAAISFDGKVFMQKIIKGF